jgi:hypothetical protein
VLGLWVLVEISVRLAQRSQRPLHRPDLTVAVAHNSDGFVENHLDVV